MNATYALFVGLNPSTAGEVNDDPTIRRCVGFARRWGYGALCMVNLFAYRATDPRGMLAQPDPVGADNDEWLGRLAKEAAVVVAAWGTAGTFRRRDEAVRALLGNVVCLGMTNAGHPRHPLYVSYQTAPIAYTRPA